MSIHLINSITALGKDIFREVHTDIVGVIDLFFHWLIFIAVEGVKVY